MKGHFVILANMNTKTRDGSLGPGAWYKPHYRLWKVSWSFYGLWIQSFNVSGKVWVEIVLWSAFWMLQCCCGRALTPWQAISQLKYNNNSHVGINYYVILYLCQYLFQPNFENKKQNLAITIDFTIPNNFCVICCFNCGKSAFWWWDLHNGDVLLVKVFVNSEVPSLGAVLDLVAGCVCTDSHLTATFPVLLCDGVSKVWVWCDFFKSVWNVYACVTLACKTNAGNAFYNQLYHVRKMYSSNLRPAIMFIGQ